MCRGREGRDSAGTPPLRARSGSAAPGARPLRGQTCLPALVAVALTRTGGTALCPWPDLVKSALRTANPHREERETVTSPTQVRGSAPVQTCQTCPCSQQRSPDPETSAVTSQMYGRRWVCISELCTWLLFRIVTHRMDGFNGTTGRYVQVQAAALLDLSLASGSLG